ncbi:cytochrome b-c1 complex subunit 7-2-like [Nannochloropsis oceanica]
MSVVAKIWDSLRTSYTRMVVGELNNYGLRYQDLFIEDPAVIKAVHHLSPEEQVSRERRIKRAIEISLKKKYLPTDLQKMQTPLKPYLSHALEEVEAEETERKLLNP